MDSVVKMIALSIPPENTLGLIPLLTWISVALAGLVGVILYGVRRVKQSEGLAPGRVEQMYQGPALTWTPGSELARKLVAHDTLGLGSDLAWLKRRGAVPASLEPQSYSSEPIIALELAAKVLSTNLSTPLEKKAWRQKTSAELPAAERIAALKNPVAAPQPRPATPAPPGVRLRTAVLRAADPLPASAGTVRPAADQTLAAKSAGTTPGAAAPAPSSLQIPVPSAAPVAAHTAPLAAALASAKPAQAASPAIEGRVTEYSFADFLPAAPKRR